MIGSADSAAYRAALGWLLGLNDLERQPVTAALREQMGLARPAALLERLGNPQTQYHSILVAGSKGKGSTAAMLASVLLAAGYRTGFYSKPHLHTYRERIRLDGAPISPHEFSEAIARIRSVWSVPTDWPEGGTPTTFEVTTALALDYFARRQVNFAVIEVGLGGRLDATNVVNADLSVIAPISLEHTAVLGDTLEDIAREKAGIIKPGRAVLAALQSEEVRRVLEQVARARGAAFGIAGRDWSWEGANERFRVASDGAREGLWPEPWQVREMRIGLWGLHQMENAATAIAAARTLAYRLGLAVGENAIGRGLAEARWPGRLELIRTGDRQQAPILVDGAHNGDSAARLVAGLKQHFGKPRIWLVMGVYEDKDLAGIVAPLAGLVAHAWAVRTRQPRSIEASDLAVRLCKLGLDAEPASDIGAAIFAASALAPPEDLVLITGSLSAVAEAREALGLLPESEID